MILSSPFSRQNRNSQTWTNGTSHHQNNHTSNSGRKSSFHHRLKHNNGLIYNKPPPPEQPAPEKPKPAGLPVSHGADNAFRSHTLNRLDQMQRRRWNEQRQLSAGTGPRASTPLRRNMSSLGHYSHESRHRNDLLYGSPDASNRMSQIYAPASIASPSEFEPAYKVPNRITSAAGMANGESQHYAATSFRGGAASESGRSGRDSAFGHLLERFGTLRRKAKWLRSSRSKTPMANTNGGGGTITIPTALGPSPVLPLQPTTLDPEIYATGKRRVEADEIYAEGLRAIDSNCQKRLLQYEVNETVMSEGETRTLIEEQSQNQSDYQILVETLTNWINDELSQQRIIVRDLQDDLNDGQILGKLIERLQHVQLDIVEVTQNEATQRFKLQTVLNTINRILSLQARWARIRWSVDGILGKNMVEIVQLLVTLALYYRAPIKLPSNVRVMVLVVQKCQGQLVKRSQEVQLTGSIGSGPHPFDGSAAAAAAPSNNSTHSRLATGAKCDAFDALIESAPEKLALVKQSLVNFVNRHLNKVNISCCNNRLEQILDPEQFSDGLLFVFLIASLEDYFVPLGNLFTVAIPSSSLPAEASDGRPIKPKQQQQLPDINNNTGNHIIETALEPTSYTNTQPIHKLHNVNAALQLMEEAGIAIREQVRAEDIVNGDLKSVLRVLYTLFSRYKHL